MVMQDKIVIDGIDVTEYRIRWDVESEWKVAIDSAVLEFTPTIRNAITLSAGLIITIQRGFVTPTDELVFEGQLTQYIPQVDRVQIVCKNRMYDAIKSGRTKVWDIDTSPEAGIGSEIFKSICDNSKLLYDNTTIPSTGSIPSTFINKFIQNDEDDFDRMNVLAELYNRTITYDYATGKVNFQPVGYFYYPHTLWVGIDIQGQIRWKQNMEQLVNKVKIFGATVYDTKTNTFAGPNTQFVVDYTPEETEVRVGGSGGTLQKRGQKDIGIFGVDFDYYIDVERKMIIFSSAQSNVYIKYGAAIPMPIERSDITSINTYGGPNKLPHFKRYTFTDIKDVQDSDNRAKAILQKYSTPFSEAQDIPIDDTVTSVHGSIQPGYLVSIIDDFNEIIGYFFVKIAKKSFPHIGDRITIGDQIWREQDWKTDTMKKINEILNELNKNETFLISNLDLNDYLYVSDLFSIEVNGSLYMARHAKFFDMTELSTGTYSGNIDITNGDIRLI